MRWTPIPHWLWFKSVFWNPTIRSPLDGRNATLGDRR
jgi:hypothetical protein